MAWKCLFYLSIQQNMQHFYTKTFSSCHYFQQTKLGSSYVLNLILTEGRNLSRFCIWNNLWTFCYTGCQCSGDYIGHTRVSYFSFFPVLFWSRLCVHCCYKSLLLVKILQELSWAQVPHCWEPKTFKCASSLQVPNAL